MVPETDGAIPLRPTKCPDPHVNLRVSLNILMPVQSTDAIAPDNPISHRWRDAIISLLSGGPASAPGPSDQSAKAVAIDGQANTAM